MHFINVQLSKTAVSAAQTQTQTQTQTPRFSEILAHNQQSQTPQQHRSRMLSPSLYEHSAILVVRSFHEYLFIIRLLNIYFYTDTYTHTHSDQ